MWLQNSSNDSGKQAIAQTTAHACLGPSWQSQIQTLTGFRSRKQLSCAAGKSQTLKEDPL